MAKPKEKVIPQITIEEIRTERAFLWIRSKSPLIYHAMSSKAKYELLYPKGRKTTAEKQQSMKHDPLSEYRLSTYRRSGKGPTRLVFPATAFKAALCDAALEVPGTNKRQIGRLIWVCGDCVDMYGVPQMHMAVVRMSDMNRTPDIRTRAILPEWACCVEVEYVVPTLNETTISRLLSHAGIKLGIGDFRQGKGKGSNGQFTLCDEKDVAGLIKSGAIKAQDAALDNPVSYDVETEELYHWFTEEVIRRGQETTSKPKKVCVA